ncbi:MAG TPA: Ig-like domain-containing protein [Candidatus Limnocylindria bacterium]|nr:Ig-like domain-containing protein [Candidatus Limnocylindria bacterium]
MHERALPDPWRLALVLGLAFALAVSAVFHPIPVRGAAVGQKVVVIVGPVGGGSIQTNYLNKGEAIADAAEARGATVVRVFSPNATYAAARAAVSGANVIVYIGHGSGFPNPYAGTNQPNFNNGWGLNKDTSHGHQHVIGTSLVYCGEAVLEGKASYAGCTGGKINPAPNFVMVYSNACYAPGAGETEQVAVSSEATALARVSNYSRPILALGGTYFATDLGSKSLVETILDNPNAGWGQIYTMASAYVSGAVKTFVHPKFSTMQAWLQKSSGPGPSVSYFNAFAGDPSRTPAGGTGAPVPDLAKPKVTASSPFTFQTGVSPSADVTATFDKSMVGLDDWNGMELYEASDPGDAMDASVSWDEGSRTVTLHPDSSLQPDTWYVVNFGDDVEDIWGNPLGDASWGFRTGGGSSPVPAATVYGPSTPLWFNPGTYVGRKVDAYGHVTSSKSGTLSATSSAPTAQKGVLPGQSGTWYLITAGLWSGMWIQESAGTVLGTPPPPPPAPIATYSPPQSLWFAPGTYVGRQFNAYGAVVASKSYTLGVASAAPTSIKSTVLTQSGVWYYITAGVWGGYWVQETAATTLGTPPPPPPGTEVYSPAKTLVFAAGTYVGRKFDASGNVTATKSYTLAVSSAAPTSQKGPIPNQTGNWYLITAGVWAGYWIQESPGTTLAP